MPPKYGSPEHWMIHARSDLSLASSSRPKQVLNETLCFHAQQAVEKAIKAVLLQHKIPFPYTHDVGHLTHLINHNNIPVFDKMEEVVKLSKYSTIGRYPIDAEPVGDDEYQVAISAAALVLDWAENIIKKDQPE